MKRRAFSLPELMIVLMILCIGGMLVIPTAGPTATIRADYAAQIHTLRWANATSRRAISE